MLGGKPPYILIKKQWGCSSMHPRLVRSPGFRLFCHGRIGNPLHVTFIVKTAFARHSTTSTMPRLHPMCYLFLTLEVGTLAKSTPSPLKGRISAKPPSILKKYGRFGKLLKLSFRCDILRLSISSQ